MPPCPHCFTKIKERRPDHPRYPPRESGQAALTRAAESATPVQLAKGVRMRCRAEMSQVSASQSELLFAVDSWATEFESLGIDHNEACVDSLVVVRAER